MGAAYINNVPGTPTTALYDIDAATDSLYLQNPPNAGTLVLVGALGVDVGNSLGFDVSGRTGFAYAMLTTASSPSGAIYRINLMTGAATFVGRVGNGSGSFTYDGLTTSTNACTPLITTAANASISGRVLTAGGVAIRNAEMVLTGNSLETPLRVSTSSFGYYTFDGLTVGETYVLTVNSRRFTFQVPSRVISLIDNVADLDFIAEP
jgi:hypothetical protein